MGEKLRPYTNYDTKAIREYAENYERNRRKDLFIKNAAANLHLTPYDSSFARRIHEIFAIADARFGGSENPGDRYRHRRDYRRGYF